VEIFSKFHKCVQNSMVLPSGLYIFCISGMRQKKRVIKEGFFGGSKTWVLFSSKIFVLLQEEGVLRPSIIRL